MQHPTGITIERAGDALVVTGELDGPGAATLRDVLDEDHEPPRTVDLSGVVFLDSAGVRGLLLLKEEHHEVVIPGQSVAGMSRKVITILGVSELLLD